HISWQDILVPEYPIKRCRQRSALHLAPIGVASPTHQRILKEAVNVSRTIALKCHGPERFGSIDEASHQYSPADSHKAAPSINVRAEVPRNVLRCVSLVVTQFLRDPGWLVEFHEERHGSWPGFRERERRLCEKRVGREPSGQSAQHNSARVGEGPHQ